jgi:hypothetical protein
MLHGRGGDFQGHAKSAPSPLTSGGWSDPAKDAQAARKPNFVLDDHSSRSAITGRLQQPTRKFRHSTLPLGASGRCAPAARKRAAGLPAYLVLLRVGFTMRCGLRLTRCALTAPFHPYRLPWLSPNQSAVYSLLHWPSRCLLKHPSRTLSGTLPCGVRTFLPRQTLPQPKLGKRSRQRSSSRLHFRVYPMPW